jgi:hypothetical protein
VAGSRSVRARVSKRIDAEERRFAWFVAQFVRANTMVDGGCCAVQDDPPHPKDL